ncbi:Uncharacterized protein FWK35_00013217 [Aphis craccivora]|uniref:Uncharacterized protein n=1 Tax=Aphis craccivora TaxID=307492 RepID=A0A6G0ZFP9_APHCR|nr:Uncharacterized protein FWK35_00013217 [Aphis craccivora]
MVTPIMTSRCRLQVLWTLYLIVYNDSERSDECIDFTMIITSRNNAPISKFGGGFRRKSEYPWCIKEVKSKHFSTVFKKIEKNKKKVTEKREFLRKTSSIFLYGCNSKTNRCKHLKFSPNVYVSVIYKQLNFQNILTFLNSIFYEICRKRENLQIILKLKNHKIRNDNDFSSLFLCESHNFFLLAFKYLRVENLIGSRFSSGVFRPLKHKPPFSSTIRNDILG